MQQAHKLSVATFLIKSGARGDQLRKVLTALLNRAKNAVPENAVGAAERINRFGASDISNWARFSGSSTLAGRTGGPNRVKDMGNILQSKIKDLISGDSRLGLNDREALTGRGTKALIDSQRLDLGSGVIDDIKRLPSNLFGK